MIKRGRLHDQVKGLPAWPLPGEILTGRCFQRAAQMNRRRPAIQRISKALARQGPIHLEAPMP
jgi:hypothetical protein